jgi:hypothetical protein
MALAVLALAPPARASTTCGRPNLLDTVPPDKTQSMPPGTPANVAPNASLFAHYDASAEYGDENVLLTPMGGADEGFAASDLLHPDAVKWDGTQGLLRFTPPDRLPAGSYTITWPALRGLNTASPSLPATVPFTVGTTDDVAPPDFEGLTGVTWDLERKNNDCTNSLENRLAFTLSLAPADDDGGRDGLTLVVFQSSGSGVDGGSVPVLSMPMPDAGQTVTVKLSVGEATGHVCFAALARDLTGKVSSSGAQTVCVDTTAPPFFRGCALVPAGGRAAHGASDGTSAALVAVLVALAVARRRRPRAT